MSQFDHLLNTKPEDAAEKVLQALGIDLPPVDVETAKAPQAGEQIIGEATDFEQRIFAEMARLQDEMQALTKNVLADKLHRLADQVHQLKSPAELFENIGPDDVPAHDKTHMSELDQRFKMLHALVHYILGERFMRHQDRLGFRTKGRIVSIGSRY